MADIEKIIDEILDDFASTFQASETRSLAIERFLKNKKIASEDELKPFLEEAGNASEIEWRATRLRLHHLFMSAIDAVQEAAQESARKAAAGGEAAANAVKDIAHEKVGERETDKDKKEPPEKAIDRQKAEEESPAKDAADRESQSQSRTEENEPEKSEDAA
jgi:hypothetical protein